MKKLNLFLITFLALTAFLAGYFIIGGDIGGSRTGTMLDKFSGQSTDNTAQKDKAEVKTFLVADRRVISPANSLARGQIIYYEKDTGKVFEFDITTKEEHSISDSILPNFINAVWSPSKKEVINSFYSQSGQDLRYYNFDTLKTTRLSSDIQSFAFSPDGSLLVYFVKNTADQEETGKIFISQPDGQYQKKILETRIEDLKLSWPAKDQIVVKTSASELFLLNEAGKLSKFLDSSPLFEEKWSQSGKKILFSALTEGEPEPILWIKDKETMGERQLDVVGSASKCAWSIDDINIICALAKSPSVDEIYAINTSDGSYKLVADLEMTAKELFLSSAEEYLMFMGASDEKLYGIKMP